jgi:hypothetical protein
MPVPKTFFKTDYLTYSGPDSGCEVATNYLSNHAGKMVQSRCFECPFAECVSVEMRYTKRDFRAKRVCA